MNTEKFETKIIRYFDNDRLVAEIYYDSLQWAEIFKKEKELVIEFYSYPEKECWEFPCEEALKTLVQAKNMLLTKSNKPSFLQSESSLDPELINKQAEEVLEKIINHPERKMIEGHLERFGDVVDIYAPDMGGARYNTSGEFIGFLEP